MQEKLIINTVPEFTNPRPIILCFVAHYLPGFCSGGPVQSIANFVDHLGDEFDIRIVTRDRDLSDTVPYPDVLIDVWSTLGKAKVFYASPSMISLKGITTLLRDTPHDILYINSFFAFEFTALPLLLRRIGIVPVKPCVIAPRGEFSTGALALKKFKKWIYISLVKKLGLYRNLHWQASSDFEKADICREFGSVAKWINVAPDLTPLLTENLKISKTRVPGPLRLIFLSRISPKKNLDFLIRVLAKISAEVDLAIYGPQEDALYWKKCLDLINQLPQNIHVKVCGQVPQEQVRNTFSEHDVFVFPTLGENFGHVIFESLMACTPVIVSNQTPWLQDNNGGLQVLHLEEALWLNEIDILIKSEKSVLAQKRIAAAEYCFRYSTNNNSVNLSRVLFRTLIGRYYSYARLADIY